jgi:iron complex transport system ATP-binding protein
MTIRLDQVSVSLGGVRVLEGVSATLARGRVTALIGPNGAGKTTLMRAVLGLVTLDQGAVLVDEAPLRSLPGEERARRLGYLPQLATPHWNVTVDDLVALGRLPHQGRFAGPSDADRAAIEAALLATDTSAFADRAIDSLSGGERARVFLARLLAGEPDWIFADEPLANLDPLHQIAVLKLLRAAAAGGKGVVVILHDLSAAAAYADDVLILKSGRLVGTALTPDVLEAAYGIAFDTVEHDGRTAILPRG